MDAKTKTQLYVVYGKLSLDWKAQIENERMEKIFYANSNQMRAGMARLILKK